MKKISLVTCLLFLISACTMHHSASVIRPENLINASAEKISFPIADSSSLPAIENWITSGDMPSGAEISCVDSGYACNSVKTLLSKRGISYSEIPAIPNAIIGTVSLTYNHILARSCPTTNFGCSTSSNSVNMVANREQFIKPALSDLRDAASAVKSVNPYVK